MNIITASKILGDARRGVLHRRPGDLCGRARSMPAVTSRGCREYEPIHGLGRHGAGGGHTCSLSGAR